MNFENIKPQPMTLEQKEIVSDVIKKAVKAQAQQETIEKVREWRDKEVKILVELKEKNDLTEHGEGRLIVFDQLRRLLNALDKGETDE